jgi:transcriptional regulator with GAF, ATPase, and Fis domain
VSRRAQRPFVAVNCAGIPESLLESELFGHVKGSFTGAYRDKLGKFEIAHGGTVFLDEVGEMTMRMQTLMLRVLQLGEVQKVGSDQIGRRVDVRIIAATNRDLLELVRTGLFREDLYYRLNVIRIAVPPLHENREDLPLLLTHFLERFAEDSGVPPPDVEPAALHALMAYTWPGNVRELANIAERLIATNCRTIKIADLPAEIRLAAAATAGLARERRRTAADELLDRLLSKKESFWSTVYPLFMEREINRDTVRQIVRSGLETARGNYKIVSRMFNMESAEYKRFLDFLRKHDCQVSFKEYR